MADQWPVEHLLTYFEIICNYNWLSKIDYSLIQYSLGIVFNLYIS